MSSNCLVFHTSGGISSSPYGHLPPITKTIQVRRTRHCWRSRDEFISDVLLWTPTHGRAKAGRPARTYIQQLCEDTGCCLEDFPRAMNDREKWQERVRDIRDDDDDDIYIYIYIYMCVCVCVCVCILLARETPDEELETMHEECFFFEKFLFFSNSFLVN